MMEIQVYTLARHKKYLVLQRGWSHPVWIEYVFSNWHTVSTISTSVSRRVYGGDVVRICTKETHPEYFL